MNRGVWCGKNRPEKRMDRLVIKGHNRLRQNDFYYVTVFFRGVNNSEMLFGS